MRESSHSSFLHRFLLTILRMVAHMSGTTLDAQKRYAEGTKDIIKRYLAGESQVPGNLIVENGQYASKAYGQRQDNATGQKPPGP